MPSLARACGDSKVMFTPSNSIAPDATGNSPIRHFSKVVLPTPLPRARPYTRLCDLEIDIAQNVATAVVLVEFGYFQHVTDPVGGWLQRRIGQRLMCAMLLEESDYLQVIKFSCEVDCG